MTLMERPQNARHRARPMERETNRTAFLIGVGSLMDLRGLDTYRALRKVAPPRKPRTIKQVTSDVTRMMSIRSS